MVSVACFEEKEEDRCMRRVGQNEAREESEMEGNARRAWFEAVEAGPCRLCLPSLGNRTDM
jgi:hypothetical protein